MTNASGKGHTLAPVTISPINKQICVKNHHFPRNDANAQWGVCRYSLTRWQQLFRWGQNRDTEMAQLLQTQAVKAIKMRFVSLV